MGDKEHPDARSDHSHALDGDADAATVHAVFAAALAKEDMATQVFELVTRMTVLLGDDEDLALKFVNACSIDPENRSEDGVEPDYVELFGPTAPDLLRSLRATFGPQLDLALVAFGEHPANWRNLAFSPQFVMTADSWEAELTIERYDGETFKVVGPPIGFLRIVNYLLRELAQLPVDPASYGDEELGFFTEAAGGFEQHIQNMASETTDD